jgi:hypothetical protein
MYSSSMGAMHTNPIPRSGLTLTLRISAASLICLALAGCGEVHRNARAVPISWATPAPIQFGTALSATQLDATTSVAGTFQYSPTAGTALTAGFQTLTATFTPIDTKTYKVTNASVDLTVNQDRPVVTWPTPAAIPYGTALGAAQLDATASMPGAFAYQPPSGTVLPAGTHVLSATFTPTDSVNYATVVANVNLTVQQVTAQLKWPPPAAITYGTALSATQLDATANIPGTFVYDPAAGTVLSAGADTLSVAFTPTDEIDYKPMTATVALTVNKATPLIHWIPTLPVANGEQLGEAQLDATALAPNGTTTVAGSFIYSPPAGTVVMSPGPEKLTVAFTPDDSTNYNATQASISMTVGDYSVAAWGDSLTYGFQGTSDAGAYPTDLAALIDLPVQNLGVSSQTSTQIGVREGGVPTTATVSGGVIPASGYVTVTFPTGYEPVTVDGPANGVTGTILGVHGRVSRSSATGIDSFLRTAPGSAVSAPGSPAFVVDRTWNSDLPIFWEGRNNFLTPSQVLSDLAAQVAIVPSDQDYFVVSILNGNHPPEWINNSEYDDVIHLNEQLANTYGSHYLDVRSVLVSHYNPNSTIDVSDYKHDEVPTSLRAVEGTGTLAVSIGPADKSITVNFAGTLNVDDVLTIDSGENAENVVVVAVYADHATVVRNIGGLNTSHDAGAPMTQSSWIHLNAQGYQIVAQVVAEFLAQSSTSPAMRHKH